MKKITVKEIAVATNGQIVGNHIQTSKQICSVTMDSRKVTEGSLFVAIPGERVDGHSFINECFDKGAVCTLCERLPEEPKGICVVVPNTVKALQDLAEYYRKQLNVTVVGITGSVGKTSTKEMISSVLGAKFRVMKTIGNYNNEIGLPLTVLSIEEEDEVAVLEMGISDFGEMTVLSKVARPDICVMTNIGQCHLETLGTREGILKAKSEIFDYMNPNGKVFVNGDDDLLKQIKEIHGQKVTTFGMIETDDVHPTYVESRGLAGTKMTISIEGELFDAEIRMIGNHMITNAMAASAVGRYMSMSTEEIAKGLQEAETIKGRCHLIPFGKVFIIDDCYNASPASMKAAIDTLALAEGGKTAILGDMFELGNDSGQMHAEVGEYAVHSSIDKLICVGKNSLNMYEAAIADKGDKQVVYFETLEELLSNLETSVRNSDNVLVKASHGMEFTRLVEALQNREVMESR